MKIERCFQILDLDRKASLNEAKQAYKDIASVWHPDRFTHNPRLKEKAERKLKEINMAYEQVESFLSLKKNKRQGQRKEYTETLTRNRTEAAAEAGTRLVLTAFSFLYTRLRGWVDSDPDEANAKDASKPSEET